MLGPRPGHSGGEKEGSSNELAAAPIHFKSLQKWCQNNIGDCGFRIADLRKVQGAGRKVQGALRFAGDR